MMVAMTLNTINMIHVMIVAMVIAVFGCHVLGVADGHLLALVARQLDAAAHRLGDGRLVAAFLQQRVNRRLVVPA